VFLSPAGPANDDKLFAIQLQERSERIMNRRTWLLLSTVFALALAALGIVTAASAALPAGSVPASFLAPDKPSVYNDGFDALPNGLKGLSYSTLYHMGKVHPEFNPTNGAGTVGKMFAPLLNITWGADMQTTTSGSAEPAAGIHPLYNNPTGSNL
jgi:hypothetical protein